MDINIRVKRIRRVLTAAWVAFTVFFSFFFFLSPLLIHPLCLPRRRLFALHPSIRRNLTFIRAANASELFLSSHLMQNFLLFLWTFFCDTFFRSLLIRVQCKQCGRLNPYTHKNNLFQEHRQIDISLIKMKMIMDLYICV